MDKENRTTLDKVIADEFSNLSMFKPGSEEKTATIDDLVKLYKLSIEADKLEEEIAENYEKHIEESEARKREEELKRDQMNSENRSRNIKLWLEGLGICAPLVFYAYWMNKGFEFEKTGNIVSGTFKNLIHWFKPTR